MESTIGNSALRQAIGTSRGQIFFLLSKQMDLELKELDLHKARSFINTFRFIDDMYAINSNGLFAKHFKEIYPKELDLKKGNMPTKASFLDNDLDLKDNKNID